MNIHRPWVSARCLFEASCLFFCAHTTVIQPHTIQLLVSTEPRDFLYCLHPLHTVSSAILLNFTARYHSRRKTIRSNLFGTQSLDERISFGMYNWWRWECQVAGLAAANAVNINYCQSIMTERTTLCNCWLNFWPFVFPSFVVSECILLTHETQICGTMASTKFKSHCLPQPCIYPPMRRPESWAAAAQAHQVLIRGSNPVVPVGRRTRDGNEATKYHLHM